jgi:DNA-binding MarR family transcriptional regulator
MSARDVPDLTALAEQVVRLAKASHAMRTQLSARSGEGMDWAAYSLLGHLVHEGPRRASVLAETACVDPSTVSRQVADLVRAGLVERRPDPEDGRATLLAATPEGTAVHDARVARRQRVFARIVDGWAPEDVAVLTALLARFNDSVNAARSTLLDELGPATRPTEETSA